MQYNYSRGNTALIIFLNNLSINKIWNLIYQMECHQILNPCLVGPWMTLKPNCGSDRAWVYSVNVDYADEEPKPELLAIKFANAGGEILTPCFFKSQHKTDYCFSSDAKKWFDAFEEAKKVVRDGKEDGDADSGDEDEESEEEEEEEEKKEKDQTDTNLLAKQLEEVKV